MRKLAVEAVRRSAIHPCLFSTLAQSREFKYRLYRNVAAKACDNALIAMGRPIIGSVHERVVASFGFEAFGAAQHLNSARRALQKTWPDWPWRLYIVLGTPSDMSRDEAENFGCIFAALFRHQARTEYPDLYRHLSYLEVHRNGRYSHLRAQDCTIENLKTTNTMHIELFQTGDVLNHYANYLMCLFGALHPKNYNLPEIREFNDESKTRRNRLFQLYLMCEALADALLNNFPELSEVQQQLKQAIFQQLRIQNPTELISEVPTQPMPVSSIEWRILNELVFPRLALIQECLSKMSGSRILLQSPAYYNGESDLTAELPIEFANKGMELVRQTYLNFPARVEDYYEAQSLARR